MSSVKELCYRFLDSRWRWMVVAAILFSYLLFPARSYVRGVIPVVVFSYCIWELFFREKKEEEQSSGESP
jgi:hypothetical protein